MPGKLKSFLARISARKISPLLITESVKFLTERRTAMSGAMRTSILAGAVVMACYGLILLEKKEAQTPDGAKLSPAMLQEELTAEGAHTAQLAKQEEIVRGRIEFSRRVARELIAQRLTLLEAANQLRELDYSLSPVKSDFYSIVFPKLYPGRSEAERYCRRAIAVVESELAAEPVKGRTVVRRLTDELRHKTNRGPFPAMNGG
jgi:hypothetical protein